MWGKFRACHDSAFWLLWCTAFYHSQRRLTEQSNTLLPFPFPHIVFRICRSLIAANQKHHTTPSIHITFWNHTQKLRPVILDQRVYKPQTRSSSSSSISSGSEGWVVIKECLVVVVVVAKGVNTINLLLHPRVKNLHIRALLTAYPT